MKYDFGILFDMIPLAFKLGEESLFLKVCMQIRGALPESSGIYSIRNLVNGKVYVGQAFGERGLYQRYSSHICALKKGKDSKHLQRAWDKYGDEVFEFEVLVDLGSLVMGEISPQTIVDEHEQYFIWIFRSYERKFGYNLHNKARGRGRVTEETKKRISERNKGKKLSEEAKRKMSLARIGKVCSQETKKKIGEANSGRAKSEETLRRMSLSHKGQNKGGTLSEEHRMKIAQSLRGKPKSEEHKLAMRVPKSKGRASA
jgi:group I intron endonuclease